MFVGLRVGQKGFKQDCNTQDNKARLDDIAPLAEKKKKLSLESPEVIYLTCIQLLTLVQIYVLQQCIDRRWLFLRRARA